MNQTEQVELAKAYVALSNAHRLELILQMFADKATYHSPHVGEFNGRDAIGQMMTDFFSRFPNVRWNARDYQCTEKGVVVFKFEMVATEALTGKSVARGGVERIEFTDGGYISLLEVT